MSKEITDRWNKAAAEVLKGRTIVAVRYMTTEEAEANGFMSRPLTFKLDNGVMVFPMRDDEGNDAGVLATTHETHQVLPVL